MKRPAPAQVLRALPDAARPLVEALVAAADARELGVYLVGGPVRDLLLERPLVDADLIVETTDDLDAEALARAAELPDARVTSHARFGTVVLQAAGGSVDVAGVRRERYAHDGALPSVEPGTLEEDLRRRDFSVNALALPLSRSARARHAGIVDVEDGLADLAARRLRVLHPRSFHDDPTRALRAARLAPRLGFSLTPGSRTALRDALRDGAFGRVSGDRLRREIVKVFDDARWGLDPVHALRLLGDWHVLGALEPGLALDRSARGPLRRIGRAVVAPPWRGRWRPWVAGLAVWLAPASPGLRQRALRRFAVRGETARNIAGFPRRRDAWLRALARARGRGAVDGLLSDADEDLLLALHASASDASLRRRIARYAGEDRGRRLPIDGDDLVALGLSGPAVGRALARIRQATLDGELKTREEALALAAELERGRPRRTRKRSGARSKP